MAGTLLALRYREVVVYVKQKSAIQNKKINIHPVQLSRLDALSWAYRNLTSDGEQKGDVTIECTDGQVIDLLIGTYGSRWGGGLLSGKCLRFELHIRHFENV